MAANSPNSPRQKMINLMYLVFIAMLALNVSSEVLDGFELVEDGLQRTIASTESQNNLIMNRLDDSYEQNRVKAEVWYNSATKFRNQSDSLFNYIQDLKVAIVEKADGKDADVQNIDNKEGVDAAYQVMLGKDKRASQLKAALENYRNIAGDLVSDSKLKQSIHERLNTEASKKAKQNNKGWEEGLFDQMPTAAAVTLLTKIQSDVRAVQGEVLSDLLSNIGGDDFRVNSLTAAVIPKSMIVMSGSSYEGEIILAAVDTTKRPRIYIGNTLLDESKRGMFQIGAGGVGSDKVFQGHIEWDRAGRDPIKIPFKTTYSVIEPTATVASVRMNVLYAGIDNELSISVPGITNDKISATVTNGNGTVSGRGKTWVARPARAGQEMIVSVTAEMNGRRIEVAKQNFKIRSLPDPAPFVEYKDGEGNIKVFRGGRMAKAAILSFPEIKAGIDDGLLNIDFPVIQFTTVFIDNMGNRIPVTSDGTRFSERQLGQIRQLQRGKSFYITDVKAKAPDGTVRDNLTSIEVVIN